MGILFFIVVTPIGLVLKIFGKYSLDSGKKKSNDKTFWLKKSNEEKVFETMKNQF